MARLFKAQKREWAFSGLNSSRCRVLDGGTQRRHQALDSPCGESVAQLKSPPVPVCLPEENRLSTWPCSVVM